MRTITPRRVLPGLRVVVAWPVVLGLLLLGPASRVARAELVPTAVASGAVATAAVATGAPAEPTPTRDERTAALRRPEVARELERLGVDPGEAKRRVASLSDAELAQVAGRLDALPAGEGAVGAIVGAALVVFLVLLVTDILGYTDVFPFVVKRQRR